MVNPIERAQRQATTVRTDRRSGRGALFAVIVLFLVGIAAAVGALLFVRAPPAAPAMMPVQAVAPSGSEFDRAAAATALAAPQLDKCKREGGPTGAGHVKVTFANDGTPSAIEIDTGAFAGTPTGTCIEERFRTVRVPPFGGAPVTVGKSFTIN